jgi:hypothetical protein
VARVEEQLLGGEAHHHVGFANVHADVAAPGLLACHLRDQRIVVVEGLAEQQATPPALERHVVDEVTDEVGGRGPHERVESPSS